MLTTLTLLSFLGLSFATPFGPPELACRDQLPQHEPYGPRSGDGFYEITTAKRSDGSYNVTLTRTGSAPAFKGVMIQAREDTDRVVGYFQPPADSKFELIQCENTPDGRARDNTVGHNSSDEKSSVQLVWNIGEDEILNAVKIRATVVVSYSEFYTRIESGTLTP